MDLSCGVCKLEVIGLERIKAGNTVFHVKCFVCSQCKCELETFIRNKDGSLVCDECDLKLYAKKCFKCQLPIQSTIVTARGKTFHNECFSCAGCNKIIKGGFFFVEGEFLCSTCDSNGKPPPTIIKTTPQSPSNTVEIQVPNNSTTNIIYVLNSSNSNLGNSGEIIQSPPSPITTPNRLSTLNIGTSSDTNSTNSNNNNNNNASHSRTNSGNVVSTLSPLPQGGRISNDYLISLQDDLYAKQQQQLLQLQQQQIQIQQQLAQQQLDLLQKNQSLLNLQPTQHHHHVQQSPNTSSSTLSNNFSSLTLSSPIQSSSSSSSSLNKIQEIEKFIPKINGKTLTELLKFQSFEDILAEVLNKKINIYKEIEKEEVTFGEVIAAGASGKVYKGLYRGRDVAIKVYSSENFCFNTEEFDREVTIMSLIDSDHPNFTRFYGANKKNSKYLFHVSELVKSGSLRDLLLDKNKPITYFTQLSIASDIASAMKYLHSIGVIHRDLKSLNILITEDFSAKVIDFGTSRNVDYAKQMTLNLGTSCYMSPELFKGNGYDESCDIYSFGITLWEIFSRKEPYEGINSWSIPVMVTKGDRPTIPSDCPSDIVKLIKACWADKPKKRPSFKEITTTISKISDSLTLKRSKK